MESRLSGNLKMAEKVYDVWLCEKLRSLQLDEDVFLDYLKGVLEEESSLEEKVETIENILQGATEEPVTDICSDIIQKWKEISTTKIETKPADNDLLQRDEKILDIIHKQQETLTVSKTSTKDEDEIKRRLLQQYAHVSENEDSDDNDNEAKAKSNEPSKPSLFENLNAKSVVDQQKAQREKQKKASEEKKDKDKANREAEKLKKQERQEKEKKRTQKGERRK